MQAAGLDSSEASAKVKEWQGRQQEFLAQTGFKRQYGIEQIVSKKTVAVREKPAIIEQREIKGGNDVQFVTILDVEKYKCISRELSTPKVIVTDTQIEHIRQRHPETFEDFQKYAKQIVDDPDYILENRPNTGLLLKAIEQEGKQFQLVLRLSVPTDPKEYVNSIITFTRVREKEWRRLIKNKKVLYKKE